MNMHKCDVIVIGAGLSGTSAAKETAAFGLQTIVLTKPADPGYWYRTVRVPHYPGAPESSTGKDLIDHVRMQSERVGAVYNNYEVTSISETENHLYKVAGADSQIYEAPVVLIATGVSKDAHFLAGERELVGKGVYYSVENEAPYHKHHSAMIIGKSEETARAAVYLARFVEKIYFVVPAAKLDISEDLYRKVEAEKKMEIFFSSSVKKLVGDTELHSAVILSAGQERELKVRAAFIYTYNLLPCSEFLKDFVELDKETGRVLVTNDYSTSKKGVFACGDVLAGTLQHPAVTSAQGIVTASNIVKFLNS